MRATVGLLAISGLFSAQAIAQEALTFDFGGRVGIGWLDTQTASNTPVGFSFEGYVLRAEGTGTLDLALSDSFNIGAVARLSLQKGQHANYELVRPFPSSAAGSKFDSQDTDVALYASLGPVTLSFGEMQTAFELATRKVEHGGSILDGGNAVWQAIGDASGSLGSVDSNSNGPGEAPDHTTLRADVAMMDFVLSYSQTRLGSTSPFLDDGEIVRSAGLTWQKDIGEGSLFVGWGNDRGPIYNFKSASVGWTVDGLNLVLSRVERNRAPGSFGLPDYDLVYTGLSASYEFGHYTIGMAAATQRNPYFRTTFSGNATAFWLGWKPKENMSVDFEVSGNDYGPGSSQDTRKASLAVSYSF